MKVAQLVAQWASWLVLIKVADWVEVMVAMMAVRKDERRVDRLVAVKADLLVM